MNEHYFSNVFSFVLCAYVRACVHARACTRVCVCVCVITCTINDVQKIYCCYLFEINRKVGDIFGKNAFQYCIYFVTDVIAFFNDNVLLISLQQKINFHSFFNQLIFKKLLVAFIR